MRPNLLKRRTGELLGGNPVTSPAEAPEAPGSGKLFGLSADFPKVIEVAIAQLRRNPDQPRKVFDQAEIEGLAASIAKHGQVNPVIVTRIDRDHYLLVGGERRVRACELLGRETLYAIVTSGNRDELAIIDNVQRVDLNAVELADALQRLVERHGYTQDQLGAIIGRSQSEVARVLSIRRLPTEMLDTYLTMPERVSRSALIEIAALDDPEGQWRAWDAARGGATIKALRVLKGQGVPAPAVPSATVAPPLPEDRHRQVVRGLVRAEKAVSELRLYRGLLEPVQRERLEALRRQIDELLL